jgi:hypothetical protein
MSGKQILVALFGHSYQTTLAGYAAAAAIAANDYVTHHDANDPQFWSQLGMAVGVAVLGRLAKDHNVSNSPSPLPEPKIVTPPSGKLP